MGGDLLKFVEISGNPVSACVGSHFVVKYKQWSSMRTCYSELNVFALPPPFLCRVQAAQQTRPLPWCVGCRPALHLARSVCRWDCPQVVHLLKPLDNLPFFVDQKIHELVLLGVV